MQRSQYELLSQSARNSYREGDQEVGVVCVIVKSFLNAKTWAKANSLTFWHQVRSLLIQKICDIDLWKYAIFVRYRTITAILQWSTHPTSSPSYPAPTHPPPTVKQTAKVACRGPHLWRSCDRSARKVQRFLHFSLQAKFLPWACFEARVLTCP